MRCCTEKIQSMNILKLVDLSLEKQNTSRSKWRFHRVMNKISRPRESIFSPWCKTNHPPLWKKLTRSARRIRHRSSSKPVRGPAPRGLMMNWHRRLVRWRQAKHAPALGQIVTWFTFAMEVNFSLWWASAFCSTTCGFVDSEGRSDIGTNRTLESTGNSCYSQTTQSSGVNLWTIIFWELVEAEARGEEVRELMELLGSLSKTPLIANESIFVTWTLPERMMVIENRLIKRNWMHILKWSLLNAVYDEAGLLPREGVGVLWFVTRLRAE